MRKLSLIVVLTVVTSVAQVRGTGPAPQTAVPRLIRVNSSFHPANGSRSSAIESATLRIYATEIGGAPLWQETQNVAVNSDGQYSVLLGSTLNDGLPMDLFASGEPRWLGIQFQFAGETEQTRILLASVPYALKAADAETLGGRPASSYMLNPPAEASISNANITASDPLVRRNSSVRPLPRLITPNFIPVYLDTFGNTTNSVLLQNAGQIGLNTTNPADYLHVAFADSTGSKVGLAVQNASGGPNAYSGMLFYDQNGSLAQFQGFNNSSHEYRINNIASSGSINFMLGSSSKFYVGSTGRVGIGTTFPTTVLDVAGAIHAKDPAANLNGDGISSEGSYTGVRGTSGFSSGNGVVGVANLGTAAYGILGASEQGYSGYFTGKVHVGGTLEKPGGSFKIDHPLDPANKYLSHSFVESPDMMNVYNGNTVTDENGRSTVVLPDYFEALNRDYRYQLTVIGQFAQVIIEQEVQDGKFVIRADKPGVKVSWQVTGIRQDAWANANRIPVVQEKLREEQGYYLHPELYGQPYERRVEFVSRPELMKAIKGHQAH